MSHQFLFPPLLLLLVLIIILPQTTSSISGPHIADVNILLPPKMTHPVEYRLQGSDGCFKWSWDHHDVISVYPEYNSTSRCSTSARLKSIAPYGGRKETAVYATDVNTGMVIRCKVYIDIVSRVKIFHNSVKLDLDGLATLRARAFDAQDNVFSSLVGLRFIWQLKPGIDGSHHRLVHIPLKDSPLSDCGGLCGDLDIQVKLEESGVFSDLYLVKGSEIGHEVVSVHLLEPSLEHLGDDIGLTVAEAMSLEPPSPVHVLVGAVLPYTLKVIRSNVPHVVSLPSPFHQWSTVNSSVAQVDREMGIVRALNLGVTVVSVEDTRVNGHIQISSLHVVLPDTLMLFLSPLSSYGDPIEGVNHMPSVSRWYVVSGRQYLVHVKVFSPGPGPQEIYLTESDDIELHGNHDELWDILPVSEGVSVRPNNRILSANSYGLGNLRATLSYSTGYDTRNEVLKVVQEVMVCQQVMFNLDGENTASERILLPFVPGVYQELELRAKGGCAMSSSDYKWFSSDMSIVSVSVSGIVQARKPGKATIRAVSIFDSLNYDELVIEVSLPSSMVMLPDFPVETPVGSHLHAAVTLKTSSGANFYACDAFKSFIKWGTESESFAIMNATAELLVSGKLEVAGVGPSCAWTQIYALDSGRTVVHATLTRENHQYDQSGIGPIVLKASSNIAAYFPLMVHQASDGNQFGGYWFDLAHSKSQNQLSNLDSLYLAPGTFLDVMLHGGPERWGHDVEFVETVEVFDEKGSSVKGKVSILRTLTSYGNPYKIGCERLGTFKVGFRRGNLIGEDHSLPAVAEVELLLQCSLPSSIVVIADEVLNAPHIVQSAAEADRLPGGIRTPPITVANGRRIRVSTVGISDAGKPFANSSSLSLKWELTECESLAHWDDVYSSSMVKSSWERFLILKNASGLCIVRSTVTGFVDSLSHLDFTRILVSLTDAIQLQLVSSLRVDPKFSMLYFNPDARLNISISGGSCFLDTSVNDTKVVEVMQQLPSHQCSQLLLAPKSLGTALVTVHDVGIVPSVSASSTVQVAEADWIKILSGEHLSMVDGSLQSITFSVGVSDGRSFDPSQFMYMKIRIHIEENIVLLVEDYDFRVLGDSYVQAPDFTVKAMSLGVTTMYLSIVQLSGREVLSQPIKIEVYAPPRVHPSDIFLVPGASYVLTVKGGPKIRSHIVYSLLDDKSAKIHEVSGQLFAISSGNNTVVATIYGYGDIMLCQAYGKVKVGIPSSAILNVQSEQLAIGRDMAIYPSLSDGNLFSFYELCDDFKWTVGDKGILNFPETNSAHDSDHSVKSRLTNAWSAKNFNIIEVLQGKSAGKTTVTVSFSCNFKISSKSKTYSASLSLWVVSDLPLALGLPITWILPPYYTSSDLLPSSSDSKRDSPSGKGTIAYSLLRQYQMKTERVPDENIYIDGAKIISMESGNLACIHAKDMSTGRVEVASCVRVAEVEQVRITTHEYPVHVLSVGAELDIPVKYHDINGNSFHEAHNITLFKAETNFPHVVSIEKCDGHGNVRLQAKSRGVALVQIAFINNPNKSEYAIISVGPQLYPYNPVLHQGTSLQFIVKGLADSESGQWLSGNRSVISVNRLSGKAEATGAGTTFIRFESSSLKLHTSVTVLKGNILSVDAPKETLTNVPVPIKGYAFSVNFADGNNYNTLFECEVEPSNVGFVKPWNDPDSGHSHCLFFPYSPERLARSAPDLGDNLHQSFLTVKAFLIGDYNVSGSASAFFVGGFSILEMDKKNMRLNFTRELNQQVITLVGNSDVKISWHDKDRLSIRPVHESVPGKQLKYEVNVHGSERMKDCLIFSLPATGQRVEIGVGFEPEERKVAVNPPEYGLWVGVIGSVFCLTVGLIYVISSLDRPARPQSTVAFGSSGIAAPVTPERSSPAVVNEQSPRTPQPFIDYVRRTIDETPYYRQDFRKRVNPQNTY